MDHGIEQFVGGLLNMRPHLFHPLDGELASDHPPLPGMLRIIHPRESL